MAILLIITLIIRDLSRILLKSMLVYVDESRDLKRFVHSIRSRMKEADHLRDKLERKMRIAKEKQAPFDITRDNLLVRINDLAGMRILHLHTTQMEQIDKCIKSIISEQALELIEGPSARTWDDEYRSYFKSIGIDTQRVAKICILAFTMSFLLNRELK